MTKSINEITFTLPELFEEWTHDESSDLYFVETSTHGTLTYLPNTQQLIVFEGTNQEYTTTIESFLSNPNQPTDRIHETESTVIQPIKEEKLTAQQLNQYVSNYEQSRIIFMNFSIDNTGVWALPEGDRTQHLIDTNRLNEYRSFLIKAIDNYTNLSRFFNGDQDYNKKLKKYKLYLKRLDNVINKLSA